MSKHKFQTEVSQLLHLIIHSLYSHKEIFLRELISNASDALDKLKYLTLTDDSFKSIEFEPKIDIQFDKENMKLTITDSGIGMNKDDLNEHLGTIARSGTKNFIDKLSGDDKKDSNLIGQFGVGFYSCYMVADKVSVVTKKAGEDKAYKWESDGKSGYSISESKVKKDGTSIVLSLNEQGTEYTNRWSIEQIVKKYSNHISFPIFLHFSEEKTDDKDNTTIENKVEQINAASAFWKQSKGGLKAKDYNAFYTKRELYLSATNGFSGGYSKTLHGLFCDAIVGTGTQMERDSFGDTRTHRNDLFSPEKVGFFNWRKGARRALV